MPMYDWIDTVGEAHKQVSVIRPFDEYTVPPTQEEAAMTEEEYAVAKWERIIGSPQVIRGDGWGAKGYW